MRLEDITPERVKEASLITGKEIGKFAGVNKKHAKCMCALELIALELYGEAVEWPRILGIDSDRQYAATWGFVHAWDGDGKLESDRARDPWRYDVAYDYALQLKKHLEVQ